MTENRFVESVPSYLRRVLRACVDLNTTDSKMLAKHLGVGVSTVNVYFQRIAAVMETADRFSAVQLAYRRGWLAQVSEEQNLLINGDFAEGHAVPTCGYGMPWTTVVGWNLLHGTPQWLFACDERPIPFMKMWGIEDDGEAIYQSLTYRNRLRAGKRYRLSADCCFGTVLNDWPLHPDQPMFVSFRFRLSLGVLPGYQTDEVPGGRVTLCHFRPSSVQIGFLPCKRITVSEYKKALAEHGKAHADNYRRAHNTGGTKIYPWESFSHEWVCDSDYDTLTINPTNFLSVRNPALVAWGSIRRVRLVSLND